VRQKDEPKEGVFMKGGTQDKRRIAAADTHATAARWDTETGQLQLLTRPGIMRLVV